MMLRDLFNWLVPMMVLTVGFSVAFTILAPNYHQVCVWEGGGGGR